MLPAFPGLLIAAYPEPLVGSNPLQKKSINEMMFRTIAPQRGPGGVDRFIFEMEDFYERRITCIPPPVLGAKPYE